MRKLLWTWFCELVVGVISKAVLLVIIYQFWDGEKLPKCPLHFTIFYCPNDFEMPCLPMIYERDGKLVGHRNTLPDEEAVATRFPEFWNGIFPRESPMKPGMGIQFGLSLRITCGKTAVAAVSRAHRLKHQNATCANCILNNLKLGLGNTNVLTTVKPPNKDQARFLAIVGRLASLGGYFTMKQGLIDWRRGHATPIQVVRTAKS